MVHTYTSTYHHIPWWAAQQWGSRPAGPGIRPSGIPRHPRSAAPARTRSGGNAYHFDTEDVNGVKLYYLQGFLWFIAAFFGNARIKPFQAMTSKSKSYSSYAWCNNLLITENKKTARHSLGWFSCIAFRWTKTFCFQKIRKHKGTIIFHCTLTKHILSFRQNHSLSLFIGKSY